MSAPFQVQELTADDALALYEDSISYFMPATFEDGAVVEVEDEVTYYEAA